MLNSPSLSPSWKMVYRDDISPEDTISDISLPSPSVQLVSDGYTLWPDQDILDLHGTLHRVPELVSFDQVGREQMLNTDGLLWMTSKRSSDEDSIDRCSWTEINAISSPHALDNQDAFTSPNATFEHTWLSPQEDISASLHETLSTPDLEPSTSKVKCRQTRSHGARQKTTKSISKQKDIEARYRLKLKDKIIQLQQVVPTIRATAERSSSEGNTEQDLHGLEPAQNLKKGTIMAKTIEYIHKLEDDNETLSRKLKQLEGVCKDIATQLAGLSS